MAISYWGLIDAVTNTNSTHQTVVLGASDNWDVGEECLILVVCDNHQTTDGDSTQISVTDSQGNTYTRLGEYTNGNGAALAGITVGIYHSKITTAMTSVDEWTVTWANIVNHKIVVSASLTVDAGNKLQLDNYKATGVDAVNDFGSVTTDVLSSVNRLYYMIGGKEAQTTATFTPSTGFSDIGTTIRSSTTSSNAVTIRGQRRIAVSTQETSNPTMAVAADAAQMLIAMSEVANVTNTNASISATENTVDTASINALNVTSAQIAATESSADTASINALNVTSASIAATDTGNADTASFAGDVIVQAQVVATDTGNTDTASVAGDVIVQGSLAATDAGGSDTASVAGDVIVQASIAATDAVDTASVAGDVIVQASIAATDAVDTASINATALRAEVSIAATEGTVDTASINVIHNVNVSFAITEGKVDTAAIQIGDPAAKKRNTAGVTGGARRQIRVAAKINGRTVIGDYETIARLVAQQAQLDAQRAAEAEAQPVPTARVAKSRARKAAAKFSMQRLEVQDIALPIDFPTDPVPVAMRDLRAEYMRAYAAALIAQQRIANEARERQLAELARIQAEIDAAIEADDLEVITKFLLEME